MRVYVTSTDPSQQARLKIIQSANRVRMLSGRPLFSGRQLHQAVQIVRHWGLVKPEVLEAAGFKVAKRTVPRRTLVPTASQQRRVETARRLYNAMGEAS